MINIPAFPVTHASILEDRNYFKSLLREIKNANFRIWASIFIIDARIADDKNLVARKIIAELENAYNYGIDVRIIIGSSDIKDLFIANETSYRYIKDLGIPIRRYSGKGRETTHSKYVIIDDDKMLLGSHNWSQTSASSKESSVLVNSPDLIKSLSIEFNTIWNSSQPQYGF